VPVPVPVPDPCPYLACPALALLVLACSEAPEQAESTTTDPSTDTTAPPSIDRTTTGGPPHTGSDPSPADETSTTGDADDTADTTGAEPRTATLHVRVAFVHGVLGSDAARLAAHEEATDMDAWLLEHAPEWTAPWMAAHPGIDVQIESARLNLYTDTRGELLQPGLDVIADGEGRITAERWREQLVTKIEHAYPGGEGNLVLVGHSTGARVSLEVAADVGEDGTPGSGRWGARDRIAGVVALHGMVEALDHPEYDFIGPFSFLDSCKLVQDDGWCEYAALVSGVPAANHLAAAGRAHFLVSWASCSPSGWAGQNDKSLPLRAQGTPGAHGMTMTPLASGALAPAHGRLYGNFCHSDVTSEGSDAHDEAVAAAMRAVLDWVFVAAPRVVVAEEDAQRIDIAPLPAATWSEEVVRGDACPAGEHDDLQPLVVGACLHEDGSDHPLDAANLVEVTPLGDCTARVRWQHLHDGELHGATLWAKTASVPEGAGLASRMAKGE
jgi:hypothetical protein